jgi:hypothetical protein
MTVSLCSLAGHDKPGGTFPGIAGVRAHRADFRSCEPLLAFYHAIMRPFWPQLLRGAGAGQVWANSRLRFASSILGPRFERICRDWTLYFAGDRFGAWPSQVTAGTVSDPDSHAVAQVDVAALGHTDGGRPPLLVIGEAKSGDAVHAIGRGQTDGRILSGPRSPVLNGFAADRDPGSAARPGANREAADGRACIE